MFTHVVKFSIDFDHHRVAMFIGRRAIETDSDSEIGAIACLFKMAASHKHRKIRGDRVTGAQRARLYATEMQTKNLGVRSIHEPKMRRKKCRKNALQY